MLLAAPGSSRRPRPPRCGRSGLRAGSSVAQLSDRYGIECKPVRDLLVGYLRERQAALDCATLHGIAHTLGKLF